MHVIYTDDYILAVPHKDEADQEIWDIQNENFIITIEGYLHDLLRINIDSRQDGSIHLTQPKIINQVLEYIKMVETVKTKSKRTSI